MPFTLLQGGSSLQFMDTSGTLTTLTLPQGVVLDSTLRPRFAVFGRYIVVVNSPTRPLTVDPEGVVRPLCPKAPRSKPVLSAQAGGTLTGTYLARQSFLVYDDDGNIIAESPLGPTPLSASPSAQWLRAANLDLSADKFTNKSGVLVNLVSATRMYRTVTGGSTYFPWIDLEGNTATSVQDDLSDTNLQLFAAPTLGQPPDLAVIGEFKTRLWGRSKTEIDTLRFSEANKMYAWPATNALTIPREGSDSRGITALISRRDALGVARQNRLYQVVGDTVRDFKPVLLSENTGVEGPDSVVVYNDHAYFLAKDGVYEWSNTGIRCLSDGKVRSWFTTDTYFNRSRFQYAVGAIDPIRNRYRLHLSAAGSTDLDRWVELDLTDGTWWGPHKTTAFTPSFALTILDSNSLRVPAIASTSGYIFQEQSTRTDDTGTGIAFDVHTKFHDAQPPGVFKWWGHLTTLTKIQSSVNNITAVPYVGGLDASQKAPIQIDMTLGRQVHRNLGIGRHVKLNFLDTTAGKDVEIFGYEIEYHETGDR